MKKIFKYALLFAAACTLSMSFTACSDDDIVRQPQFLRDLALERSYLLIALIEFRKHILRDAADITHFLRPALILNIQKEHA